MPETRTIQVYKVSELRNDAKDSAYYRWLENEPYGWESDNRKTLDEFVKVFPVKVTHWEYSDSSYSIRSELTTDDVPATMSRWRLATYIWNNYGPTLFPGKYYSKGRYVGGKYQYKSRRSKIILQPQNCCLTGFCRDEDILDPVYDFLKRPDSTTFEQLMRDCCKAWAKACSDDMEASTTMEVFEEYCEDNDMRFEANGVIFRG